ncbi:MAG: hypothetical protein QM487_00235, partial [Candidatus Marithrix sp.]
TYLSLGFYIFGKLSSFLSFVYFTSNYSLSPVPENPAEAKRCHDDLGIILMNRFTFAPLIPNRYSAGYTQDNQLLKRYLTEL